jgi:hypothetical protein
LLNADCLITFGKDKRTGPRRFQTARAVLLLYQQNYFGVNPVAKVSRSQDQASVDVQRINLIGADTSTVTTSRAGSFHPKNISVRSCTMLSESVLFGNLNLQTPLLCRAFAAALNPLYLKLAFRH